MSDSDIAAVINVINLYGLAMDTQRWDLFDRIFTRDVEADFSETAHWKDLDSFKRDFGAFHAPFDSTQHTMANHVVEVTGDTAHAFTYGTWRLHRRHVDGGDVWQGSGWYDDGLVRTQSGWLIRHRVCRVAWWSGNPLVQEALPGAKFDLHSMSLRSEAQAGNLGFLRALAPR